MKPVATDVDLFARIRQDDRLALNELFSNHYQKLCRFAFSFLNTRPESEEAVADIFFLLWKNRQTLTIDNIKAYLYTSVRNDHTGYILVSDQQANQIHIFSREGSPGNPHEHVRIKTVELSTNESDGNDVTSTPLPGFPRGLFVAMSDDKTFQIYRWEDFQLP